MVGSHPLEDPTKGSKSLDMPTSDFGPQSLNEHKKEKTDIPEIGPIRRKQKIHYNARIIRVLLIEGRLTLCYTRNYIPRWQSVIVIYV
jgi:hypothetical protein